MKWLSFQTTCLLVTFVSGLSCSTERDWRVPGGAGNGLWSCRFSASMIAPVKKSVNHSRTVASMRETGWEQQQLNNNNIKKFVFAAIRQCEVNSLLVLLVIASFAVTDFFFPTVMWSLRFPFFWSCVCHYMRFTTLRTRPVNSHCTCSSMPDLLAHYRLSSCVSV